MAEIELYTKPLCPYCIRAKSLLKKKGVSYKDNDISMDKALRAVMIKRAEGRSTVPQVFIDGVGYGGFDDINALNKAGKLDAILGLGA